MVIFIIVANLKNILNIITYKTTIGSKVFSDDFKMVLEILSRKVYYKGNLYHIKNYIVTCNAEGLRLIEQAAKQEKLRKKEKRKKQKEKQELLKSYNLLYYIENKYFWCWCYEAKTSNSCIIKCWVKYNGEHEIFLEKGSNEKTIIREEDKGNTIPDPHF